LALDAVPTEFEVANEEFPRPCRFRDRSVGTSLWGRTAIRFLDPDTATIWEFIIEFGNAAQALEHHVAWILNTQNFDKVTGLKKSDTTEVRIQKVEVKAATLKL